MDQEIETKSKNPLRISLVLLKVFRHLDVPSLKEARQVCFLWNFEASPFLMEQGHIKLISARDKKGNDQPFNHEGKKYGQLMATLDQSPNPGLIFKNLHLDFAHLKNVNFLPILIKYGPFVMSLVVKNCKKIERAAELLQAYLHPVLTQYCPNLTHLKVGIQYNKIDRNDRAGPIKNIVEALNLESIEIDKGVEFGGSVEHELNVLVEVIKASPKLKTLNVNASSAFEHTLSFCKGISTLENVKNLEEFVWKFGQYACFDVDEFEIKQLMELLQIISKMEMKKLRILSMSNLTLYNPEMVTEFLKFFKMNGRNLSKLTLTNVGTLFGDENHADQDLMFYTLEFQEILKFCPDITSMDITGYPHWDSMSDLGSLNMKPYPRLTKLFLSTWILKNVESFNAIVEWFPNLIYLNLDTSRFQGFIMSGPSCRPIQKPLPVEESVSFLEALQNLLKLEELVFEMGFSYRAHPDQEFSLINVINATKGIPGLKRLSLTNAWGLRNRTGRYTMDNLKDALMQTASFDSVRLVDFLMNGDDEKMGIPKFISENKLPVEFKCFMDPTQIEEMMMDDDDYDDYDDDDE